MFCQKKLQFQTFKRLIMEISGKWMNKALKIYEIQLHPAKCTLRFCISVAVPLKNFPQFTESSLGLKLFRFGWYDVWGHLKAMMIKVLETVQYVLDLKTSVANVLCKNALYSFLTEMASHFLLNSIT